MKRELRGALAVILAAVIWSFDGILCKLLPWSGLTVTGLRALVSVLPLGLARRRNGPLKLNPGTVLGALGMSLTGLLYMCSVKLTTAANAIALQYAMPLFVILLCVVVLHEKPTRADVVTAGFVMFGVLLCFWKSLSTGGGRLAGDLLALASAVTYALVFFCGSLPGVDAQDYVFLGALMSAPLSVSAFFDPAMTLEIKHIAVIVVLGLCVAGGYYFLSVGLKYVSPVTSALLANIEPVLCPVWAFLILREDPGLTTLFGAAVVIAAVSVYTVRKARMG